MTHRTTAIVLALHVAGYSHAEIAEKTKQTVGQVRHALKRLGVGR